MGKVGSTTLRRSFKALNTPYQPYHLHYMSGIDNMIAIHKKQWLPLTDHILSSIYCKKYLKTAKKAHHQVNVITMVREPIGKNLSQFFQNIEVVYPEFGYREKAARLSRDKLISELSDFFVQNFVHKDPLVWFDVELKRFTGIDVYEFDFSHEKGFRIYENEDFRVLLIRLENLNACISEAMDNFMGIKKFTLINENVSDHKEYAKFYKELKRRITLPDDYIEEMYASKMAAHFYTESELQNFSQRWRRDS